MQVSETNALQTIKVLFDNLAYDYVQYVLPDTNQAALEYCFINEPICIGVDNICPICKAVQILNDDGTIALVLGDQKLGYNRL